MENTADKLKKLPTMTIPELLKLHKMYCIHLHPLWIQVCNKY